MRRARMLTLRHASADPRRHRGVGDEAGPAAAEPDRDGRREPVAYHAYEGIAPDLDEQPRLVRDLGDKGTMILGNHGTLTVGETVAEAFMRIYFLEWACGVQVRTLASGQTLRQVGPQAAARTAEAAQSQETRTVFDTLAWPALRRMLDRRDPSYRD